MWRFIVIILVLSSCDKSEKVLKLNSRAMHLYYNSGLSNEVIDSGIFYINEAIQLDKKNYYSYDNLTKFLKQKNDYKELISTLNKMQKLSPNDPHLVIREAQSYELFGDTITSKKLYIEGIESFKKIIDKNSDFDLRQKYFISLVISGNENLATEEVKRLYKKYPNKTLTLLSFLENSDFWMSILN